MSRFAQKYSHKFFLKFFIQNRSLTLFRAAAEIEPYHEVMIFFDLVTL